MFLQLETALEQLNRNDSTVEGVLVAVIIMLIVFIVYLLTRLDKKESYIREEDKKNRDMFNALANKVASSETGLTDIKVEVGKVAEGVNKNGSLSSELLTVIKERLI